MSSRSLLGLCYAFCRRTIDEVQCRRAAIVRQVVLFSLSCSPFPKGHCRLFLPGGHRTWRVPEKKGGGGYSAGRPTMLRDLGRSLASRLVEITQVPRYPVPPSGLAKLSRNGYRGALPAAQRCGRGSHSAGCSTKSASNHGIPSNLVRKGPSLISLTAPSRVV